MKINSGPISYENWKASERYEKSGYGFEFRLFTDALVTGEIIDGYGPYQFFNTVPKVKPHLLIYEAEDAQNAANAE